MASEAAALSFGEQRHEQTFRLKVRPVDLVHLSRYTLGERTLEKEVLELFCTQAEIYLARLGEAKSETEWRDAAHSLKGSAQAIGAWRTAEAAQHAEVLSGETLVSSRSARLAEIESALREAEAYICTLLKDR